ncbi:unnamed protein product, partial [Choristocarpus tenellus]
VCGGLCRSLGYPFFGLQYGRECRCGVDPGSYGNAGNCVMPCHGDSSKVCGGAWANTIYGIRDMLDGIIERIMTVPRGSTKPVLELNTEHQAILSSPPCHIATTCVKDLNGSTTSTNNMNPVMCGNMCLDLGFKYFAVSWSEECSCGNHYGTQGTNMLCGGGWANSVYSTKLKAWDGADASERDGGNSGTDGLSISTVRGVWRKSIPRKIKQPMQNEVLTVGRVVTVMWQALPRAGSSENKPVDGSVDLWVKGLGGGENLLAKGVDTACTVTSARICQHSWEVVNLFRDGMDTTLELRRAGEDNSSSTSVAIGWSNVFFIREMVSFDFVQPNRDSIPVAGGLLQATWTWTGKIRNVWLTLNHVDTGKVVKILGMVKNTGHTVWAMPLDVEEGVYYLEISPVWGSRRFEKSTASELFRVASPSSDTKPPLSFVTPVLDEYVDVGQSFLVTWTSPNIPRVKV